MAFRVGQLVVCIEDMIVRSHFETFRSQPAKGEVVTVREVFAAGKKTGLTFEEHINGVNWSGHEIGFDAIYFRPLTSRNIEIVEALKAPPPEQVEPLSPLEVAFQ